MSYLNFEHKLLATSVFDLGWQQQRHTINLMHLTSAARAEGLDVGQLLGSCSLDESQLFAQAHIELGQELALLEEVSRMAPTAGFGLRTGGRYRLTSLDILGYAMLASNSILDALEVSARFAFMTPAICPFFVEKSALGCWVLMDASALSLSVKGLVLERGIGALLSLFSDLLQRQVKPLAIVLEHGVLEQQEINACVQTLDCPILFSKDTTGLLLDWTDTTANLPLSNQQTSQQMQNLCQSVLGLATIREKPFSQKVHDALVLKCDHAFQAGRIAEHLSISVRTLHRHLRSEGRGYSNIVQQVRKELASTLLLDSDMRIEQIALELGYSEAASFSRAFKQWHGIAPCSWRNRTSFLQND